jgi:hypothetical protein
VIVFKRMDGQPIHHRASRNVRHISITTSIIAGRESLTSFTVASQDCDPVRRRLMSRGVRLSVDVVFQQWSKPYVNSEFFFGHINSIFIRYLNKLWESEELSINVSRDSKRFLSQRLR